MLKYSKKSKTSGRGWSDFRMTVYLSGVSMLVNQRAWLANCPAPTFGSRTRRMLYLTSSLVNSRPVWNWTPLRRFSLICLKSVLTSQLSASIGCGGARVVVRQPVEDQPTVSKLLPANRWPSSDGGSPTTPSAACRRCAAVPEVAPLRAAGAAVQRRAGAGALVAAGAGAVVAAGAQSLASGGAAEVAAGFDVGGAAGTPGPHAASATPPAPVTIAASARRRLSSARSFTFRTYHDPGSPLLFANRLATGRPAKPPPPCSGARHP